MIYVNELVLNAEINHSDRRILRTIYVADDPLYIGRMKIASV